MKVVTVRDFRDHATEMFRSDDVILVNEATGKPDRVRGFKARAEQDGPPRPPLPAQAG